MTTADILIYLCDYTRVRYAAAATFSSSSSISWWESFFFPSSDIAGISTNRAWYRWPLPSSSSSWRPRGRIRPPRGPQGPVLTTKSGLGFFFLFFLFLISGKRCAVRQSRYDSNFLGVRTGNYLARATTTTTNNFNLFQCKIMRTCDASRYFLGQNVDFVFFYPSPLSACNLLKSKTFTYLSFPTCEKKKNKNKKRIHPPGFRARHILGGPTLPVKR